MDNQFIQQQRVQLEVALSYLNILEHEQDAYKKNIVIDWYNDQLDSITESRIPKEEKSEYFNLKDELTTADVMDQAFAAIPVTIYPAAKRELLTTAEQPY